MDDGELRARLSRALGRMEQGTDVQEALDEALAALSDHSGCESVGIRWQAGEDYPYLVTRGFGRDFVVREGPLCERSAAGLVLRHPDGTPQLACMCGAVATGRADPRWPFFTPGGSFWVNQASAAAKGISEAELGFRVRAYCPEVGYQVVAVIPLRHQDAILGVLQLNCRQPGRLTLEMIELYEELGRQIAETVAPHMPDSP